MCLIFNSCVEVFGIFANNDEVNVHVAEVTFDAGHGFGRSDVCEEFEGLSEDDVCGFVTLADWGCRWTFERDSDFSNLIDGFFGHCGHAFVDGTETAF